MKIERRPISSLSDERFIENYYQLDKPIILTGVQSLSQELCTPEYIKNRFWKESQKKFGWYAAALPDENDDIKVPSIFRTLSESSTNEKSDSPMRLWVQPKGNKTNQIASNSLLNLEKWCLFQEGGPTLSNP